MSTQETLNAIKAAGKTNSSITKSKAPKSLKEWIVTMEPQIKKALPSVITPERFTRMAMTALSTNRQLQASTPESFVGAMMQAAQLGLEPNTPLGQAYLIPYRNHGVMQTQFQIGYKGLIDLAHRSGEFQTIYAETVYENDEFDYELGLEPKLVHKPAMENRGNPIYYYAVYKLVNGGYGFEVMSKSDIELHAKKFSKAFRNGPWESDFDEMAKKTVLKKVLKYAPIKTEFARGVASDGTITLAEEDEDDKDAGIILDQQTVEADYTIVDDEEEAAAEANEANK